jgi:hypothetical protein
MHGERMQQSRYVAVGQFDDARQGSQAIAALQNAGFPAADISILTPVSTEQEPEPANTSTRRANHGAKGLVAGAAVGGLAGGLAGLRALPIPTVGPFIAAGAVALGAGIGTLAVGTFGLAIPRVTGRESTLVLVRAGDRLRDAERIMREHGASRVQHAQEGSTVVPAQP